MKYHINRTEAYSIATIDEQKTPVVTALITVDIHQEQTESVQVLELLYSDALLSGTEKYSRAEFLNAVNLLGASIGISVSGGVLNITLKSTADTFKKLLTIVEAMLLTPTFAANELKRIKTTVSNELHESKENSATIAHNELCNTIYGQQDRRFSYSPEALISALDNISAKNLRSLHSKVLGAFWTCSIAADTAHIDLLGKTIQKIKRQQKLAPISGVHQQKPPKPGLILKSIPSRQNIDFSIGAPIPFTLHHPDYIPLSFALMVLARWGGFSGRLMSTVRELEGLTYTIYGKLDGFSGTEQGYWRIGTFFAPEKAIQGVTSTFREIKNFFDGGITADELERFKTICHTHEALLHDGAVRQLHDLHSYHCHNFTLEEMREHKARVADLTIDEVNHVIKTYLDPKTITVSAAGPISSIEKDLKQTVKKLLN